MMRRLRTLAGVASALTGHLLAERNEGLFLYHTAVQAI